MSKFFSKNSERYAILQQNMRDRFARPAPLIRIIAWALLFFAAILFGTSQFDAHLERKEAERKKPRVRVLTRDGLSDRMPEERDSTFLIAVVGASEAFNRFEREENPQASLAHSLLTAIPADARPVPIVRDYSYQGMKGPERYEAIQSAVAQGADLILVTYALHGLPWAFAEVEMLARNRTETEAPQEEADPFDLESTFVSLSRPGSVLNSYLDTRFSSYENHFAQTLFPLVRPWEVIHEADLAPAGDGVEMFIKSLNKNTAKLQELVDTGTSMTSIMMELSIPASEAKVPIVFILTPVDKRVMTESNIATAKRLDSLYRDSQINSDPNAPTIWSVTMQDIVPETAFRDAVHLNNFGPLTEKLLPLLILKGNVPNTWGVSHEE